MSIDNRWFVLLAVAALAAVGATVATKRLRNNRVVKALDDKRDVTAWENEGGNLTPIVAVPVLR